MAWNKAGKLKMEEFEMNKKDYTSPQMDIKKFEKENIVTNSIMPQPQSLNTEGIDLGSIQLFK